MLKLNKKFTVLLGVALLLSPLTALAGSPGSITFAPGGAGSGVAIPTMGAMGLILMSLVLAAIAVQHIRSQGGIGSFFVGLLLVGAIAGATGGLKLVQVAHAGSYCIFNPEGGTFGVDFGLNTYFNDSGVPQRVVDLTLPDFCGDVPVSSSKIESSMCKKGGGLVDGGTCTIECGQPE